MSWRSMRCPANRPGDEIDVRSTRAAENRDSRIAVVRIDLDHALRIAARLEDEETLREIEQRK